MKGEKPKRTRAVCKKCGTKFSYKPILYIGEKTSCEQGACKTIYGAS